MVCNNSLYSEHHYEPHTTVGILRILVAVVVTPLIITSNIVNILVLPRMTALNKVNRVLFVNLAIADLLTGLIGGIPTLMYFISADEKIVGDTFCTISALTFAVSVSVSILTLSAISITRYLAVSRPIKYRLMTRRASVFIASSIWVYALSAWTIPMAGKGFVYEMAFATGLCLPCLEKAWAGLIPGMTTTVPCHFILFINSFMIIKKLKQRSKPGVQLQSNQGAKIDHKATWLLLITTSCFVLCWVPYTLFMSIRLAIPHLSYSTPGVVRFVLIWLGVSNSFFNVLIYSATYKEFRLKTVDILAYLACRKVLGQQPNITAITDAQQQHRGTSN